MGRYATAGEIINRAARELGLQPVADPFASSDPNFLQLIGLLTSIGQELAMQHEWPQLIAEKVITTIAGKSDYELPQDFLEMVNQTGWNRSTRLPVGGPLSPSEWQYLKAALTGVVFNVLFRTSAVNTSGRVFAEAMRLFPTPGSSGIVIAFEYRSRNWVSPINTQIIPGGTGNAGLIVSGTSLVDYSCLLVADSVAYPSVTLHKYINGVDNGTSSVTVGIAFNVVTGVNATFNGSTMSALDSWEFSLRAGVAAYGYYTKAQSGAPAVVTKDAPTISGDVVLYDPLLMVRALKLQWLGAKGLDTSLAAQEYEDTLRLVRGGVEGAPRLSLNQARIRDRFLDNMNVPITGYGT